MGDGDFCFLSIPVPAYPALGEFTNTFTLVERSFCLHVAPAVAVREGQLWGVGVTAGVGWL